MAFLNDNAQSICTHGVSSSKPRHVAHFARMILCASSMSVMFCIIAFWSDSMAGLFVSMQRVQYIGSRFSVRGPHMGELHNLHVSTFAKNFPMPTDDETGGGFLITCLKMFGSYMMRSAFFNFTLSFSLPGTSTCANMRMQGFLS